MIFDRNSTTLLGALLVLSTVASAQWVEPQRTGSAQGLLPDRTMMAGMCGLSPQLEVSLVENSRNAADKKAVVHSEVWGVDLVQPQSNQEPKQTQAYLTYQLDGGDVIKTVEEEQTFTNISPGRHHVYVQLASLDGQPVGTRQTLTIDIPK